MDCIETERILAIVRHIFQILDHNPLLNYEDMLSCLVAFQEISPVIHVKQLRKQLDNLNAYFGMKLTEHQMFAVECFAHCIHQNLGGKALEARVLKIIAEVGVRDFSAAIEADREEKKRIQEIRQEARKSFFEKFPAYDENLKKKGKRYGSFDVGVSVYELSEIKAKEPRPSKNNVRAYHRIEPENFYGYRPFNALKEVNSNWQAQRKKPLMTKVSQSPDRGECMFSQNFWRNSMSYGFGAQRANSDYGPEPPLNDFRPSPPMRARSDTGIPIHPLPRQVSYKMDYPAPNMNLDVQGWDANEPNWVRNHERAIVPEHVRERRERERESSRTLENNIRKLGVQKKRSKETNSMEKHVNAKPFEPKRNSEGPYTLIRSNSDGDLSRHGRSQGFRRSYSDERHSRYSHKEPDVMYSSMHHDFYQTRESYPPTRKYESTKRQYSRKHEINIDDVNF